MALLDAIGQKLEDDGVATQGTNLFLSLLPDSPDICYAIFEYAGSPPIETMGGTALPIINKPRFQILTRAARDDYQTARTNAATVRSKLAKLTDITLSSIRFLRIFAVAQPFGLGDDNNGRPLVAQNFEAWHE